MPILQEQHIAEENVAAFKEKDRISEEQEPRQQLRNQYSNNPLLLERMPPNVNYDYPRRYSPTSHAWSVSLLRKN